MLSHLTSVHRPQTIAEALALLQKNSGTILVIAGGSKLSASRNDTVRELVDISALGLDYLHFDAGLVRIGAATPLQALVEDPKSAEFANGLLAEAVRLDQPALMMRNTATVGGELLASGSLSTFYCALLVLQAQVRLAGAEEFALPINIFLNKKPLMGGLLIEVLIPRVKPRTYAALVTFGMRARGRPALCACARVTLENGCFREVKLALTGADKVPQRQHRAESRLENQRVGEGAISLAADAVYETYAPVSDSLAGAEFRKEVSPLAIRKALQRCLELAEIDF